MCLVGGPQRKPLVKEVLICELGEWHLNVTKEGISDKAPFLIDVDVDDTGRTFAKPFRRLHRVTGQALIRQSKAEGGVQTCRD